MVYSGYLPVFYQRKMRLLDFFRPLLSLVEDKEQKPVYLIHPEGENCLKKRAAKALSLPAESLMLQPVQQ